MKGILKMISVKGIKIYIHNKKVMDEAEYMWYSLDDDCEADARDRECTLMDISRLKPQDQRDLHARMTYMHADPYYEDLKSHDWAGYLAQRPLLRKALGVCVRGCHVVGGDNDYLPDGTRPKHAKLTHDQLQEIVGIVTDHN